jgi:ribosomal protein S18 acetylase RimI-like enzyme
MLHKDVAWRQLTGYDLDAVVEIAGIVHPDFFERRDVLEERQRLYPTGCYLLEIGEKPTGYVLSHPWRLSALPALDALLGQLPADPDTYYLHDIALLPVARRVGAAGRIVSGLIKHAAARGFGTMSLVAVNGSAGYWERHGFAAADAPDLYGKLLSYEEGARYMVRPLP